MLISLNSFSGRLLEASRLVLDDAGFATLGNALLLGYLVKLAPRWFRRSAERMTHEDRAEYSERRELWNLLEREGALDNRIAVEFDVTARNEPECFTVIAQRLNNLVNSDADIVKLRLEDIVFSPLHLRRHGLGSALRSAAPYDLRTPIALLGPTTVARCLRKLVLEHFRRDARLLLVDSRNSVPEVKQVAPDAVAEWSVREAHGDPLAPVYRFQTPWSLDNLGPGIASPEIPPRIAEVLAEATRIGGYLSSGAPVPWIESRDDVEQLIAWILSGLRDTHGHHWAEFREAV